uniref:CSON002684 protein n=1 Tax=Culicoides sonorensis TaxID=179676 RepID=A0A336LX13_CULSO
MNTPTNRRPTGKIGSPVTPSNTSLTQSPLTSSRFYSSPTTSGSNSDRLDFILKQIITWHEKWQAAHRRGISLCSSIEVIKRRAIDLKEKDKNTDLYPIEELQGHCNNLSIIMTILEDVISNTKVYVKQLETFNALEEGKSNVIFKTWDIGKFVEVAHVLLNAYEKEFQIKTIVKENIAHGTTKSELAWHSSVWQYPVYLNSDVELLLKFLKVEIT